MPQVRKTHPFVGAAKRASGLSAQLVGPAGAAFVSRAGQTLLAFILARTLGVEGYGLFIFALGTAILAGMVAGFGWPNVINREMPRLIRTKSWGLLRGLNRAADGTTTIFALICSSLLFGASFLFADFATGLRLAAILTLPFAIILVRQQQLIAADRPSLALLLDQGMAAAIVLAIVLFIPMAPSGTLVTYGIVIGVLIVVGTMVFRRLLPREVSSASPQYRLAAWIASGGAMFSSLLPRILVTRLDVLMVAPLAGLGDAGLFGSAFRLSILMTFPQVILQSIVTPRFSRAFSASDFPQVRRLYGWTLAFAGITALPFLAPALIAPEWVMATLFGQDFSAGGEALFWLAIGQFIAAFGVALNAMIAMGGNHKAMGLQGAGVALLTFIAGFIVIPEYGVSGAALVLLGSNVLWVAGLAYLARPILTARAGTI